MTIRESNLSFSFPEEDNSLVIKFDDSRFYRDYFCHQPEGKGMDILACSNQRLQMIEIKNCSGYEAENIWRTRTNNAEQDGFDVEVVKKVASTIACLYGAWSKSQETEKAGELLPLWTYACNNDIPLCNLPLYVILFLEGNFGSASRTKKTIMLDIRQSIQKKLKWLNCKVFVVDSNTYNNSWFTVS